MTEKIRKKAEVIAAIALMLFSALLIAGSTQALEPTKGTIDFVLLYNDVETGDSYYLSDVGVYLYDMNGHFVSFTNSTANGIVDFSNVPYGNYVIRTEPVKKSNYLYCTSFSYVRLDANGVKNIATGTDFNTMSVDRYPLSHQVNLTIEKDGVPIMADVELSFMGYDYSNFTVYGNATFNVTEGLTTIKIVYDDGGVYKDYYKDLNIAKDTASVNVTVDIAGYQRVIGTVMDKGKIVNTETHIIAINKTTGDVWKVLTFNGGAFSFFLPSANYKLVITADGYSIYTLDAIPSTVIDANVVPVTRNIDYSMAFSNDMSWVNITYTTTITNKTVFPALPYSDTGVLYYQMKLLGWSVTDLEKYVKSVYRDYTSDVVEVNNDIYGLANTPVSTFSAVDAKNMEYKVTIVGDYYNSELIKSELLKEGSISVSLFAQKDHVAGENLKYKYVITIPTDLERSNDIATSVASVSGWVGQIDVSDVQSTPVNIVLKERKSPEITLDKAHLVIGWANMTSANHIVNQSADNYTVVIPGSKHVWINASRMAYDVVRDKYDTANTTYAWYLNGKLLRAGVGYAYANETLYPLGMRKDTLTIKVTDVGGNTNETNITLLADNAHPTVNITIKDPSGKVLLHMWENNNTPAKLYYKTNATDKTMVVDIKNGVAKLPAKIVFNQTEEIVYDAENSFDTYNYVDKTNLPVIVEWDFNGNKSTGANRTYAFDKPTRKGPYTVNVTLADAVNNTVKISMDVIVRDITKPIVRLNFTVDGKNVNEVKEQEDVTLNATGSYDPDNGTIASYNWTIKDEHFKNVEPTDKVYEIVNGSFASGKVTIKFLTFGTYYIILNVTDGAGNYNVVNKTLRVTPVRPDLAINSVNIKGDRVEGSKLTFVVNVSNNGNAPASSFWLALYVNGKAVYNHTFKEGLKNGTYKIVDGYWTPAAPGNYTVTVKVGCANEPSSYLSDNEKKETVQVAQAPWKLPAMIGGSIAIIALIGFVAWKYMQKKNEKKKFKKKSKGGKKEKD
ncbi:MAG: hypothetical protein GXO25_04010 [Euryarchaeota archaeon]|nr:hypothetical protein [Euryarchaeota archaeon]